MIVLLDTFPASSTAKRSGKNATLADHCREWVHQCERNGHTILVPAIAYYEALRELEQRQASAQAQRLQMFCRQSDRFLPLTTGHLEVAARLWGRSRRAGLPTASSDALDGDVILAAQALSLELDSSEYVVATTNVGHLSRFVPAEQWTNILP